MIDNEGIHKACVCTETAVKASYESTDKLILKYYDSRLHDKSDRECMSRKLWFMNYKNECKVNIFTYHWSNNRYWKPYWNITTPFRKWQSIPINSGTSSYWWIAPGIKHIWFLCKSRERNISHRSLWPWDIFISPSSIYHFMKILAGPYVW